MCNLYTVRPSMADIAKQYGLPTPALLNTPADTYPGGPGLVIREAEGNRVLESMTWGFPLRLKGMKPESKPKPVNNIAELGSYMWRFIAPKPEHRCLIPVSAFAEAEGAKGSKTRTWFTVTDQPVFCWAGMWKQSDEWGAVYSGLMTDANDAVRPVHDRMPVILLADEHERWMKGNLEDVQHFQARVFPAELLAIERTAEPWIRRKPKPAEGSASTLI